LVEPSSAARVNDQESGDVGRFVAIRAHLGTGPMAVPNAERGAGDGAHGTGFACDTIPRRV
jgi:hypothetical protein